MTSRGQCPAEWICSFLGRLLSPMLRRGAFFMLFFQAVVQFECRTRIVRVIHGRDARATWQTATLPNFRYSVIVRGNGYVSSTAGNVIFQVFDGVLLLSNNCLDDVANRNDSDQPAVL